MSNWFISIKIKLHYFFKDQFNQEMKVMAYDLLKKFDLSNPGLFTISNPNQFQIPMVCKINQKLFDLFSFQYYSFRLILYTLWKKKSSTSKIFFFRPCHRGDGFLQSTQSLRRNGYHAWRHPGLRFRWHWCCLPKVLSCHQRAFKSYEKSGK